MPGVDEPIREIDVSFPNRDSGAYRELLDPEHLSGIRHALRQNLLLDQILTTYGYDPKSNIQLKVFNYGHINAIAGVSVGDSDSFAVLVCSRPREIGIATRGIDAFEATKADFDALELINHHRMELAEKTKRTGFPSTPTTFGSIEHGNSFMMLNETVGARAGSVEVNLQSWQIGSEVLPVFMLNPYTAIKPERFRSYFDLRSRIVNINPDIQNDEERQLLSQIREYSDRLAEGYVAALTEVWFLTGQLPRQFSIAAGDGVYDGSALEEGDDFKQPSPIKLITIRGGLSSKPLTFKDGHPTGFNLETLQGLKKYLNGIVTENSTYADQKSDPKIATAGSGNTFSADIIQRGIKSGLTRILGENEAEKVIQKLQEDNKNITDIWREMGLEWKIGANVSDEIQERARAINSGLQELDLIDFIKRNDLPGLLKHIGIEPTNIKGGTITEISEQTIPLLAPKVKNPHTLSWLSGFISASAYKNSGLAKKSLFSQN